MPSCCILGDSSGYLIGRTFGPRLFKKEKSFFFRKDYLLRAQAFYDRHGAKTVIAAKFVPFLRTFVPVVAGAASGVFGLRYRTVMSAAVNVVTSIGRSKTTLNPSIRRVPSAANVLL